MILSKINPSGGRTLFVAAACGALALFLSGCAPQANPAGIVSYQELDSLYDQEVEGFPWDLPAGESFPDTIPMPDNEETLYQSNNARAMAFFYWQCAWMDVYFENQSSDPDKAAAALDVIKQTVGNSYKDPFYEDSAGVWAQIVDDAAIGDVGQFKTFYDSGCSTF